MVGAGLELNQMSLPAALVVLVLCRQRFELSPSIPFAAELLDKVRQNGVHGASWGGWREEGEGRIGRDGIIAIRIFAYSPLHIYI